LLTGSATAPTPAPVEVIFDEVPKGATVSRASDGKPLGTTPFSAPFKPHDVGDARPASKARRSRPTSAAAPSPAEAQKLDRSTVFDPFE
jgi:hypothetical protein